MSGKRGGAPMLGDSQMLNEMNPADQGWMDDDPTVIDLMDGDTSGMAFKVEVISEREFENTPEGQHQYEQFMREPIVLLVHSTTDKNASPVVPLGCNGMRVWVPRNKKVRLRRFMVEVLARASERSFTTKENPDRAADNAMEVQRNSAAPYGFSILHDPHPKGRVWLERITRQGC